MNLKSSCNMCALFERLNLPYIGFMLLIISAVLGVFSFFVWPLLFVWPIAALIGLGLAAGYESCQACDIST